MMTNATTTEAKAVHPFLADICPACHMAPGVRCEDHNGIECAPHLSRLVAQVKLATDRHGVIVGSPAVLSAICARLGFKNRCEKGSVYITDAKLRFLGLAKEVR